MAWKWKHVSSLATCAVLGGACADTSDSTGETGEATSTSSSSTDASSETGEPPSGEALYAMLCASCHGPAALGSALAYELRHPPHDYARWVIRNGRSGGEFPGSEMAAYPEELLDDAEVDAILAWLDGFEQPTTGEALYLDYCGNCHGADAAGGVVQKPIEYEGAGELREKIREGEGGNAYGDRFEYMPHFAEDRLGDDEIDAIAEYVAGL